MDSSKDTKNNRFAWLTFRPAPGHPTHLDEFLTLLLPNVHKSDKYAYVVEDASTINQHFHCLVSGNFPDKNKVEQRFLKNVKMTNFIKYLNNSHTQMQYALKAVLVSEKAEKWFCSDVETLLGYVMKTDRPEDKETIKIKGFTAAQCLQADKIYFTSAKHQNKIAVSKQEWIPVNKKNCHNLITKYCEENDKTIRDTDLIKSMKKDAYTFIDLPSKVTIETLHELMLHENKMNVIEERIIDEEIAAKLTDGKYSQNDVFETPMMSSLHYHIGTQDKEIKRLKELVEELDTAREYPWVYQFKEKNKIDYTNDGMLPHKPE